MQRLARRGQGCYISSEQAGLRQSRRPTVRRRAHVESDGASSDRLQSHTV